ncbi:MAG: YcaO-like family protein [Bacteroidota bacterium]
MSYRFYPAPDTRLLDHNGTLLVQRPDSLAVVTNPDLARTLRALHLDPDRVEEELGRVLAGAGLALALAEPLDPASAARWKRLGVNPEDALEHIRAQRFRLAPRTGEKGRTGEEGPLMHDALAAWGLQVHQEDEHRGAKPPETAVWQVLITDDALSEETLAAAQRQPRTLLVVPARTDVWVMRLGEDVSIECLQARLRHNQPARRVGAPVEGSDPLPLTAPLAALVASYVAQSSVDIAWARRWVRLSINGQVEAHPVVPRPSRAPRAEPRKAPTYRDWLSPVTGFAQHLQTQASDAGLYNAVVRFRMHRAPATLDDLKANEQQVAGGQGWSEEDALRSATFEAIERFSGTWRDALPHRWAAARDLGPAALLPAAVDLHSERQRATPTPSHLRSMVAVPHPLDPDLRIRWVEAAALGGAASDGVATRWFPAAGAFYAAPEDGERYALPTSNGCAAGTSFRDAAWRGLCELIERDAVAIWWYNRVSRPALDLTTLDEPRLAAYAETLVAQGRTLDVFDITTDLGVPAVAAASRRIDGPPGWVIGFGAAATYTAAATSAVFEVAQMQPATDSPAEPSPATWADTATLDDLPHLAPVGAPIAPPAVPALDLDAVLDRLDALGIPVYAIDQTDPDIGVAVVRVLAPGLVHFWRRLGAARLYEVPVRLGWRTVPIQEAEVNPLDLTF